MKHGKRGQLTRRSMLKRVGVVMGGALAAPALGAPSATPDALAADSDAAHVPRIPAWYYQHFDADFEQRVPEEHFGGWKREELDFALDHTAVVVMHAWDAGTREAYPGWWRCVPYLSRANTILRDVFPPMLSSLRASGITLFHVVGGGKYYQDLPGYQRAAALAGPPPPAREQIARDACRKRLDEFRNTKVFVGAHNAPDVARGFARLDFAPQARPQGDEGIAENGAQLFALCKHHGINHLVYCGFAINWCLLLSPGGMADMQQYGLMCSALRQAVTAVENKESAKKERAKELALWRVALAYGFVFDVDDFVGAVRQHPLKTG